MKYSKKTKLLAPTLLGGASVAGLIDRLWWAESAADKSRFYVANPSDVLSRYYLGERVRWPQKVTRTNLECHLGGRQLLHYSSNRESGKALLRVDLDVHDGQSDLTDAVAYVRSLFPRSYGEPSTSGQGYAIYPLIELDQLPRARFNEIVDRLERALRNQLGRRGITTRLELQGKFALRPYLDHETGEVTGEFIAAKFGCLPLFRTDADVDCFLAAPAHPVHHVLCLIEDDRLYGEVEAEFGVLDTQSSSILEHVRSRRSNSYVANPDDAFCRMNVVCFEFTLVNRRLPSLRELLDAYRHRHGGDEDRDRIRRAEGVISLRRKKFDPARLDKSGYEMMKASLLRMVGDHVQDRSSKYTSDITDEDLAIGLALVTANAFDRCPNPNRQYTLSTMAFPAWFQSLKAADLTRRGCNRNKATAIKLILERAGLIQCIDRDVVAGGRSGISQKWAVGPRHESYPQWLEFSRETPVVVVAELRARSRKKCQLDCVSRPAA